MRRALVYLAGGVDPVELGHEQIEDGDIGLGLPGQAHGLEAIVGLAHDLEAFPLEDQSHALTHENMVVGEEDPRLHEPLKRARRVPGGLNRAPCWVWA